MAELDKVKKGLECLAQKQEQMANPCSKCDYHDRPNFAFCVVDVATDALALLKEQEAKIEQLNRFVNGFSRDAMPVVRCKDCRWGDLSKNIKGKEMIFCYNGDTGIEDGYLHEPEWFCAEGIAKDIDVLNK